LDGGVDGLDFYRKITKQAIDYFKFGSYLCYEIGYDQKDEVIDIINKQGNYSNTYCKKDLGGNDRVIVTQVN
jgi:release factor glutamine methyltransferase